MTSMGECIAKHSVTKFQNSTSIHSSQLISSSLYSMLSVCMYVRITKIVCNVKFLLTIDIDVNVKELVFVC